MSKPLYPRRPKRRKKRVGLILLLLVLLICLLGSIGFVVYHWLQHRIIDNALGLRNLQVDHVRVQSGTPFYTYENEDDKVVAVPGIDVSMFQGEVDWQAVKNAGAEFVIIRAAYRGYETGRLVPDETFARNIEGAAAANLDVGVYLYSQALNEQEAEEEADYLLELIRDHPVTYPIVYDQEENTTHESRTIDLTGEQATKNALAFCRRIYEAEYIPMIYVNHDWAHNMYDMEQLDHYPVWYADYTMSPALPGGFAMWQYTDEGQIPGIKGPVDLNLILLPSDRDVQ